MVAAAVQQYVLRFCIYEREAEPTGTQTSEFRLVQTLSASDFVCSCAIDVQVEKINKISENALYIFIYTAVRIR